MKLKEGNFARTIVLQNSSAKLQDLEDSRDEEEQKGTFSLRPSSNISSAYDTSQILNNQNPGNTVYVSKSLISYLMFLGKNHKILKNSQM